MERLEEEFEVGEEDEAIHEYEQLADSYLAITASLIADEVLPLCKKEKGFAVDLGCGPGGLVRELAVRLPGYLVIGLDISFSMARLAKERTATENAAFVVADVHHLPLRPGSITLIVSHGALHHWRQIQLALSEAKMALAEDGSIYLSDLKRDTPEGLVAAIASQLNERQARAFLNSVKAAYTIDELAQLADASGLASAQVGPESFSRQTIAKNIARLRKSPMQGVRQAAINLRLILKQDS